LTKKRQLGLDAPFLTHQIGMLRERPAGGADQRLEGRVLQELAEDGAGAARLLVARRLRGVGRGQRLMGTEHLVHAGRFPGGRPVGQSVIGEGEAVGRAHGEQGRDLRQLGEQAEEGAVAVPVEARVIAVRIRGARRLAAGIREWRHSGLGSMRREVRRWSMAPDLLYTVSYTK
jgi:hypothetical protein